MTEIFLALGGRHRDTLAGADHSFNALISYAHPSVIKEAKQYLNPKLKMLDSGAYSAWNSGKTIDIDDLIEATKDPYWTHSVCLDVIGDAEASVKNSLYMKAQGSPAFPVFHIGDPWEHLAEYKRVFNHVGLSCRFGEPVRASMKWLEECFARAWPCRFHSFGWISPSTLYAFPFDTADATSWMAPGLYGHSVGLSNRPHATVPFARGAIHAPGNRKQPYKNLQFETRYYDRLGRFLAVKWKKELTLCRSI